VDKGELPGVYVHPTIKTVDGVSKPGLAIEKAQYETLKGKYQVNSEQKAKLKEKPYTQIQLTTDEAVKMIAASAFILKQTGISTKKIHEAMELYNKKYMVE
jgi:hypothetical protein